ncbi:MAG: glycosyltransferase [Bacteroidetes bacterium]|nr:glycosyltransferase [Bacteroidota bacterium]MDF2452368.1 glycosyltransferase [Bacteroidota bacterium]
MAKIFIIGPAYPLRGGLATFDELFCDAFNKQGHDCEIISYSLQYPNFLFPGSTQYDTSGIAPTHIKIHTLINSVNPLSWIKTARFIKKNKPDFIVFRFWIPFMGPALGSIARIVRKSGITVLAITDNVIPHEKRAGDSAFSKYFIGGCDGFVTMSKAVMKDLEKFTDTIHKKYLLHPLYTSFGEKLNKAEARTALGLPADKKLVLFFGLIRKYKGLDMLLDAMHELNSHPEINLVIAGEFYEDKQPYLDLIEKYEIKDRVILHGKFIANEEVKLYFSAADLVALPYRSATQSGVTQVSFHFEVPTLVTNVGGLSEIIPDKVAGYVVDSNGKAIAEGISDYFTNNRMETFTQGMIHEKKKYDWKIFVDEVYSLFQSIKK